MAAPLQRSVVHRRALVRAVPLASHPISDAEARLAATLAEVTALDAEVEELSGALAQFERTYERLLAQPFSELDAAERLVRRLQALEDEVARLADPARARPADAVRRAARQTRSRWEEPAPTDGEPGASPVTEADPEADWLEAEDAALKRLHRRLARVLHPDFARDDEERARLGESMAQVNAAYARRDLAALEVMAARVGAGEPPGDLSEAERLAHLEKRIAVLSRIARSLCRERDRMRRSDTSRLRDEAARREENGGDFFEETRTELADATAAAAADARARLTRLGRAAQQLSRSRSSAMSNLVHVKRPGGLRAFDPLSESALVRRGVAYLERARATPASRDLAREIEESAARTPWEAVVTLFAFFAETAGRPPESLASPDGWVERYDAVRAGWPEAPAFDRVLARLPSYLEVGLRMHPGHIAAGVQLRSAELVTGVRIALERADVARLGRQVLETLGPRDACPRCGEGIYLLHLMRTRGLDELNGLACPRCGAIRRSYWRYGEIEGLEALSRFALQLGSVREQVVRFGGTAVGFQLLPSERERLTARRLRRRFHELYFQAYALDVPLDAVRLETSKGPLGDGARVPERVAVRLALDGASGISEEEALERLRSRIERRFRPDAIEPA